MTNMKLQYGKVHAVSHYQSVLLSQVFNLQQLHKYYRFFDCYIQLLANKFTKMRKKADDYFFKL